MERELAQRSLACRLRSFILDRVNIHFEIKHKLEGLYGIIRSIRNGNTKVCKTITDMKLDVDILTVLDDVIKDVNAVAHPIVHTNKVTLGLKGEEKLFWEDMNQLYYKFVRKSI